MGEVGVLMTATILTKSMDTISVEIMDMGEVSRLVAATMATSRKSMASLLTPIINSNMLTNHNSSFSSSNNMDSTKISSTMLSHEVGLVWVAEPSVAGIT